MKTYFKKILSLLLPALIFTACSQTEFRNTASEADNSIELPETVVLSFDREITTSNVDMIWVVDNSVSMSEEIQIIRNNLGKFLLSLEDRAKLNFTLITNDRGSHGMALSQWALDRGYKQIAKYINSHDSLVQFIKLIPQMMGSSLKLNSKKVIVIVSDDNSELSYKDFLFTFTKIFNLAQIKIFGFVGIDKKVSPCIDYSGKHYIELAKATGGQIFNICESDWTPHFNALIKDVGEITKTKFTLPSAPKGRLIVKVDGKSIDKFLLDGLDLIIHPDNFPENRRYNIEVVYLPL